MPVASPVQIVVDAGKNVTLGIGCTVMVKVPGGPLQPRAFGMTV